jgi:hypothetical protein
MGDGMDAFVQLALVEKAKRVFAVEPDVDLCFPLLSPLTFTAAELAALMMPASSADYMAAGDFARMVNFLPRGPVANVSDRMLWDVYRDVLERAEVAAGIDGAGASAGDPSILYETAADGSRVESEALRLYRQYRDAWFVAREDYASHKLTGELSDDPAVRQHWTEVEEPELRAVLDAAAADWETLGRRNEVELALQAQHAADMKTPGIRWSEWKQAFMADIDMISEVVGAEYAPTGLSPRNFADQAEWLNFDLSADEMRSLVDSAPDALKVVLGNSNSGRIERVSFEYRSVALVRPWFRPEALTSRIWRSADPDLVLSDGADPPGGTCPSYPVACVFIRNVTVKEKAASAPKPFQDLRFNIDPQWFRERDMWLDPSVLKRFQRQQISVVEPQPAGRVAEPATQLRPFRDLVQNSFTVVQPSPPRSATIRAIRRRRARQARPFLHHAEVLLPGGDGLVTTGPTETTPAEPAPRPETLSILAFICKRLPKTPDPAPGMRWT